MPTKRGKRLHELSVDLADLYEASAVSTRSDGDLFVIDKVGSTSARKKLSKTTFVKQQQNLPDFKKERKIIARIEKRKLCQTEADGTGQLYDIWETDVLSKSAKIPEKNLKLKKLKIIAGLSYHPSVDDHQDVIAEVD